MTETPAATLPTPKHVAIIMDGNARWAKRQGQPLAFGHRKGAAALRNILRPCADAGIECVSVYAFSHENWLRPEEEVKELMFLLDWYLKREIKTLVKHGIRLKVSGDMMRLPESLRVQIQDALRQTANGKNLTLNVCLSYGARQEITKACHDIAIKVAGGELTPDAINDALVAQHLYTHDIPDPDLLIRTGGDCRISNFLLWQCAYAELYFCDVLWPDFDAASLQDAITAYSTRDRRYGKR